ncbi:AraC family transcriptional regulator [Micromonospora rosaria]|uniref:AraC family transcriptional regulator n=1 Tax=Micromonospora rosaria TaxID=47874 RepID=A0A136PZY2_9ACTN|nr:helix-turn-helix domain-containing protein [Micromonospora rosaria]KXK64000.1 AraC family transcriptional regulator [Micromonospora rosaria]
MHRVVALVRPVQSTFELGLAAEVFGTARAEVPQHYEFGLCAERPGAVLTSAGYVMSVSQGLSALDAADTVIIPGWSPVSAPLSADVRAALLHAHARGARLVTICSGVFALARTGLLDGRSATTHWARADQLRREFPRVRVTADALYVDHSDVATSAGAGAGIDLCLHLVRQDHGAAYAALLARHMVMPAQRAGGHKPYVPSPTPGDALDGLLAWAGARLAEPLSVGDLAAHLRVSPRTLARRFAEQLGTSPGAWLLSRRVSEARALLEKTDLPVEAIAARVGLWSAVNLRRRFRAQVGTTPSAYRRAFRAS